MTCDELTYGSETKGLFTIFNIFMSVETVLFEGGKGSGRDPSPGLYFSKNFKMLIYF
jgi:hypothetical protein